MSKEIVAFGEIAVSTKDGALFVAKKDSVEGRAKITLVPVEDTDYYERLENPESFEAEPEVLDPSEEYHSRERDIEEEAQQELDAEAEMESLAEAHANDCMAEHEAVYVRNDDGTVTLEETNYEMEAEVADITKHIEEEELRKSRNEEEEIPDPDGAEGL